MVGDKISNLIIALKNASSVSKDEVLVINTKLNFSIAEVLMKKGFIESLEVDKKGHKIKIALKYDESGNPAITDVKRVSKLSRRIYKNTKSINPVKNGYGISVISTPVGVMSDSEAREKRSEVR